LLHVGIRDARCWNGIVLTDLGSEIRRDVHFLNPDGTGFSLVGNRLGVFRLDDVEDELKLIGLGFGKISARH
jgi:hypothetical protein